MNELSKDDILLKSAYLAAVNQSMPHGTYSDIPAVIISKNERKRRRMAKFVSVRTEPKIGRNDKCPCGSGKKYKICCLNKQGEGK